MFSTKKKYYLIIENTRDIDLNNIKLSNKFIIIYRNNNKIESITELKRFRSHCRIKKIGFFVANNWKLLTLLKADGLYISAHNKDLSLARFRKINYQLIGSIHNIRELSIKRKQMCSTYIVSRLFKTNYKFKDSFFGVIKFNLFDISGRGSFVALGGININNLNKLKLVNSDLVALLSQVKKKPAIISRLF